MTCPSPLAGLVLALEHDCRIPVASLPRSARACHASWTYRWRLGPAGYRRLKNSPPSPGLAVVQSSHWKRCLSALDEDRVMLLGAAIMIRYRAIILGSLVVAKVRAGSTEVSTNKAPASDEDCYFDYGARRCEPADQCVYKYRFLDATFSESCRLKEVKEVARPTYKTKIMTHPIAIAGGAAALFAADILAIVFTPLLQQYPLSFNIIQGFILCVAGDTLFQLVEQGALKSVLKDGALKAKKVGLKSFRAIRSGLIGSLNNGLIHYTYYKFVDRRFPYHIFTKDKFGDPDGTFHKLVIGFAKWAIEFPTIGVYKIVSMMALTAALGGDLKALPAKLKKRFFITWLRSLQVWPIYDTLLYAYVPASHRPLFNTCMSLLWSGYLSSISQPEAQVAQMASETDNVPHKKAQAVEKEEEEEEAESETDVSDDEATHNDSESDVSDAEEDEDGHGAHPAVEHARDHVLHYVKDKAGHAADEVLHRAEDAVHAAKKKVHAGEL